MHNIHISFRLVSAYVDKVVGGKYKRLQGLNFSSFVNLVLKQYNESECHEYYNDPCSSVDQHWRPFTARCAYCDIPYDVVGRIETFQEDIRYILLKKNLTTVIPLKKASLILNKSHR